jgi:hypothetical protein
MDHVVIERSPSVALEDVQTAIKAKLEKKYPQAIIKHQSNPLNMKYFFDHVEESIQQKQLTQGQGICLDFNTALLGIFHRLEIASEDQKAQWEIKLKEFSELLASKKYPIRGLSIQYDKETHLKFVAALINSFIATSNLIKLRIERYIPEQSVIVLNPKFNIQY